MLALTRRAIGVTVLAAVVAGPALAARLAVGAADCDGSVVVRKDGWTDVRPPAFGDASGREELTAFAASPQVRDLLYVTNGASVQRSADAGCTWEQVFSSETFRVGQLTLGPDPAQVVAVEVPPRDPSRLYVLLEETTAVGTVRPAVLTSADTGTSYELAATGLPATGTPVALSPGLRRGVAYLAVGTDAGDVDVYATTNSGAGWTRRGAVGGAELTALAVDPRLESRLWAVVDAQLLRSDDGGATFRPVPQVSHPAGALSVSLTADSTRIAVADDDDSTMTTSFDDGDAWRRMSTPSQVGSIAAAAGALPSTVVAGDAGVHVSDGETPGWIDLSPSGEQPSALHLSDAYSRGFDLIGLTTRGLLRIVLGPQLRPIPKAGFLPPIDLGRVPDVVTGEVQLSPRTMKVNLKPDEVREVDLVLDLPPVPTPLDVVFLIDTTGSMGSTIAGLRDGIGEVVRDLADAGIEARFGLGDYKDYPFGNYGGEGDYPYRLLRRVGPPDDAYAEAIGQLQAGGGGDGPESSLTALYQAVTGAGQKIDGDVLVETGRDAGFRAESMRVVIVATDAPFHQEGDYPGPDFDTTAKALRDHRVLQMGLSVGGGVIEGGGRRDLEAMAIDTGTLAPVGVDCNGDRTIDVRPGEPLVCDVDPLPIRIGLPGTQMNLAPAIIGLLRSVRDEAPVSLRTAGETRMAQVLAPATYPRVDVKVPNRLRYRVRLECSEQFYGLSSATTLEALRRSTVLTRGSLDVACAAPPGVVVARALPPPPPPPQQPVAVAAAPPPPPPAQQPPTQTNPQSQPQLNPNPQMQAGAAYEEQQEHELALAYIDVEQEEELAMSALPRTEPDPRPLWASGLALTLAAGVAVRRRTARQEAPAWTRR